MKRKICLIITILFMAVACTNDNNDGTNKNSLGYDKAVLEAKLIEYGKMIYDNDTWLKGGIEPFTYYMTLKEMSERNKYDISMFKNTKTNNPCDLEKTRIEFVVSEEKQEGVTNYKYNPVLVCD